MKYALLLLIFVYSSSSFAQSHESSFAPRDGILIAQDNYDAYDPFADYSEFDEATDEEEDIYFFKNGRFFTIGLIGGYRILTDTYGQIYTAAPDFGISMAYFFDLRLAMQVSYITGAHNFSFMANGQHYNGTLTISGFSFDLKYYLNVQNTTKGISSFNPYITGGISQLSRELRRNNAEGTGKDSSMAFEIGIGTEFPMVKNKYHLGFETIYQYVSFPDEGKYLVVDHVPTSVKLNGDVIRFQVILGFNF